MLILSPPIPGNFGGASCGTLGGLNYIGDEILAMTYQRKNSYFNGKYNDKNEVEIAFFFSNFTKKIKEIYSTDGGRVDIIKSAKYGANILVALGTSSANPETFFRNLIYATGYDGGLT